ncbi:bidirectional hydrogenase complex protein HoxU [Geobacter hydrogenophilus]|uniref:Hydrogenase HoxU n=1 Tax=Geobacter hydrogenophilus TaxID=40983 RepID=A0A9W6FXP2_9BACT|nr:bidirectional hydrogenase complex protein HoxU [Geobacter hydrogenophilus]MBT0895094.1 bidirectional hydrogenase complex protein HoxU [Geobacter hydrogenophilus]GLI36919.1 hydrogenase HoxU [Geobacter hydrogenophilus]
MSVVTLTIDDELVSGRHGETLLQVIREHGMELPTLCHMEGLSERGGCRLCIVEVEGSLRPVPACSTVAQEGMVVRTATDRLIRYRRMIVELLFAERNHYCAVCVSAGNCELQTVAATLGVDHVRYEYLSPRLTMDLSHERFGIDHNRCILCTRCVRVCDEVEGVHTWDVSCRGVRSRVIADLNHPWGRSETCTSCGKCVQVCPTGALFAKGAAVGEMVKDAGMLTRVIEGRDKKGWNE